MSRYEGLREKADYYYVGSMLTPRIAERKCFSSAMATLTSSPRDQLVVQPQVFTIRRSLDGWGQACDFVVNPFQGAITLVEHEWSTRGFTVGRIPKRLRFVTRCSQLGRMQDIVRRSIS
jgi:hypothetical protein